MAGIFDRFKRLRLPAVYYVVTGDAPTSVLNYTATKLYQTQDNLQAVVNYLANSVAQLPLKVYVRDGETERRRDRDSVAARVLYRPNEDQTAFEFFRALAVEYFVYGTVYVWVLEDPETDAGLQLRILPSTWIIDTEEVTNYAPSSIRVSADDGVTAVDVPASEFVQFRTYSAGSPGGFISPISALRNTLREQIEAGKYRQELWASSGRLNAQILRPKDVAPWDDDARHKFLSAFHEAWGPNGSKAGSFPLLEDGMEIKPFSTSFKEQQWAESIQMSREAVAAAYGLNPALIWHTGTQTYASAKDNARALYAECLGPVLQMIQQRINSFLLPMLGAGSDTYVEFDFAEKLKGSFEERASILQSAVGGPWMTRNEARADNNLPPIEGGDELIVPLNVIEGGQASPNDTHMDPPEPMAIQSSCGCARHKAKEIRVKARSTEDEDEAMAEVLKRFFNRQADSVLPKIGAKSAEWWDKHRWDMELADDIEPIIDDVADAHGREVADVIGSTYNAGQTRKYLRALAEGRAAAINEKTYEELRSAIASEEEEDTPAHVFDLRAGAHALILGGSLALVAAGWSSNHEAPQQARQQGITRRIEKQWITGDNPRPSHASMNGERVPVDQPFSNGAFWPGDDNLSEEESCGCNCSTEVIIM